MDASNRDGGSLFEGHVGRLGRHQPFLRQTVVLGIGTETETGKCEHLVTLFEPRNNIAYRFDLSGQLLTQYPPSWPSETKSYSDKGLQQQRNLHTSQLTVPSCSCCRADSYQDLIVLGSGFPNFFELEDIRRSVFRANYRSHVFLCSSEFSQTVALFIFINEPNC